MLFVPKYLEDKNNKNFCILCILGILNSGWIEHCGFAYVLTIGLFWLIDLFKNKKAEQKEQVFLVEVKIEKWYEKLFSFLKNMFKK